MAIIAMSLSCSPSSFYFSNKFGVPGFLQLLISSDKAEYKLDEVIRIDARIINNSNDAVYICQDFIADYTLYFHIVSDTGEQVPFIGGVPKMPTDYNCHIWLFPTESIGKIFALNEASTPDYYFPKGTYKLYAIFGDENRLDLCKYSEDSDKSCAPIESNHIEFSVK